MLVVMGTAVATSGLCLFLYLRDGPPPQVDDLKKLLTTAPNAENGFLLLLSPDAGTRAEPIDTATGNFNEPLALEGFDREAAEAELSRDSAVLERVDDAVQRPFGTPTRREIIESLWPIHDQQRLISLRFRLAYETGQIEAALADALLSLRLGKLLAERTGWYGFYKGYQHTFSGHQLLAWLLERVQLNDEQAVRISRSLLDLRIRPQSIGGVLASLYFHVDAEIDAMVSSAPSGWRAQWHERATLRPNTTRRVYADWFRDEIYTFHMPMAHRVSPHLQEAEERCNAIEAVYSITLWNSFLMNQLRATVDQRDARSAVLETLVAVMAYRNMTGALPDNLSALATELGSTLPLDPYSGKPLCYDRERRLIYSVGPTGTNAPTAGVQQPESISDVQVLAVRIP